MYTELREIILKYGKDDRAQKERLRRFFFVVVVVLFVFFLRSAGWNVLSALHNYDEMELWLIFLLLMLPFFL